MDNLINIYTKIKLRIGCEIIVTYYRHGSKMTKNVTLLDFYGFTSIFCSTKFGGLFLDIDFFSSNVVIESIKVPGSSVPIYYNPYVSKNIYTCKEGFFTHLIDDDCLLEIKRKMFGDEYINLENDNMFVDKYVARDALLEKYIARDSMINYDDLFFSDKQKEEFELFFKMLVDELSEYAKRKGMDNDLKFVSTSTTSLVYEIGDKIIKIGKPRRCNYIPYCEYILQPIINRDFSFDGYPIHVEVTQKVHVLENKDKSAIFSNDKIFNEKLFELREQLSLIGLNGRDLHPGNIGILLDENKIHYDGISFDVGSELVTSIESNNNLRILERGKFVIIDLDCLKIDDIVKYSQYLNSIGYNEDDASELIFHSRCLSRR